MNFMLWGLRRDGRVAEGLLYDERRETERRAVECFHIQQRRSRVDRNAEIIKAVIVMGHSLNLHIIAEGVETEAQFEFLKEMSCDVIQGFLFSMPLSVDDMTRLLEEGSVVYPLKSSSMPKKK